MKKNKKKATKLAERIIREIEKYDVVSFDVFDTLIKRDLDCETDLFDYVEREFNRRLGKNLSGFKNVRIAAEQTARYGGREVTLAYIYTLASKMMTEELESYEVDLLKNIELELEEAFCQPSPDMIEVFRYCENEKKRILVVSDMYLDGGFIHKLLNKVGFGEVNAVYVSSDIGKSKKNGALFKYVLDKERLYARQLVHIGDGRVNDYIAPQLLGVKSIHIPKSFGHTEYWKSVSTTDSRAIAAFINNRLPYIGNEQVALGYEVFGPLLYIFTKWLTERLDLGKPILFFARDGYVIKKAYDIMTSQGNGTYFLASRKSLTLASLGKNFSIEEFEKFIRIEPMFISLEGLLCKFGLNPELYRDMAEKCGLNLKTIFSRDNIVNDARFQRFWTSMESGLRDIARRQTTGFFNYFETLGCGNWIQVVDIGWRCTMQYCLEKLLPEPCKIEGYYIGVKGGAVAEKGNCEGFYIDGKPELDKDIVISAGSGLIEAFFTAPHGSVAGYAEDGTVLFEQYERREESEQLTSNLQEGALRFVQDMSKSPLNTHIKVSEDLLFRGLAELAMRPKRKDITLFAEYPSRISSGVVKMADPKGLLFYLIHPKIASHDFANSPWKIGFMKKMLKFPLPYDKLYRILYRMQMKQNASK